MNDNKISRYILNIDYFCHKKKKDSLEFLKIINDGCWAIQLYGTCNDSI